MTIVQSKNGDYLKITANTILPLKMGEPCKWRYLRKSNGLLIFNFYKCKHRGIGQLFRERRVLSLAAGNILPDMSLDTDSIMEPYNHGKVLFTEYEDGTTKAIYADINGHFIEKKMKISVYSNLIQKLPDQ